MRVDIGSVVLWPLCNDCRAKLEAASKEDLIEMILRLYANNRLLY